MSYTVFGNGLGYEGKVTLTLKSNNHILKSKTYKNNGTAQLFKFLCHCSHGSYTEPEAKNLLPNKILLLYNNGSSPVSANPKDVIQQSLYQQLRQSPTMISDSATAQASVIYSFEVSKAEIFGPFNQIALYGVGVDDITEFSAYHYLTDHNGDFETLNAGDWSSTTVLLVEWELTLSNKNIETINSGRENT